MIDCLRTRVRTQPIIALYFESETRLYIDISICKLIDRPPPDHTLYTHTRTPAKEFG